ALSSPHGRVELAWTHEDAANLSITWREIGGPAVAASPDCKYGVSVIRDLVPKEFGGSVDLIFASSGVCCKIGIPLDADACNGRTNKAHSASFALSSLDTRLRRGASR